MDKSVKFLRLNICHVLWVLLWINYWLMWFESLLVFISNFKFNKKSQHFWNSGCRTTKNNGTDGMQKPAMCYRPNQIWSDTCTLYLEVHCLHNPADQTHAKLAKPESKHLTAQPKITTPEHLWTSHDLTCRRFTVLSTTVCVTACGCQQWRSVLDELWDVE